MSSNNTPPQLFQQTFSEYLKDRLSYDTMILITKDTASCISVIPEFHELVHIQYKTHDGEELEYPRLWRKSAWLQDVESWRVRKAYSDKERIKRWLFEANVAIIKKTILKEWLITPDHAGILATRWLRDVDGEGGCKIKALGVTLKTKEEEL